MGYMSYGRPCCSVTVFTCPSAHSLPPSHVALSTDAADAHRGPLLGPLSLSVGVSRLAVGGCFSTPGAAHTSVNPACFTGLWFLVWTRWMPTCYFINPQGPPPPTSAKAPLLSVL